MVLVNNTFCIDRYEASRPDATASSPGTQTGAARCAAGVIPWTTWPLTQADAATACALAGKRLCSAAEWQQACSGPQQTIYGYGNLYDPTICNGIDTYCLCGAGQPCDGVTPCPYPHCFNQPPPGGTPAQGCGAFFHVTPTGALPGCVNGWGLFDMNGNVWEVIASSDGLDHFRGGAYNCGDSETLHRCDYDATWGPTAQGFRCCADPP
jgi:formylglycine-generating enzyme required for sulfatase activity